MGISLHIKVNEYEIWVVVLVCVYVQSVCGGGVKSTTTTICESKIR